MKRGVMLGLIVAFVFVGVAGLMLAVMPRPLKDSDFLVIGSASTLAALLALFLLLVTTTMKSSEIFFKKRKK